MDGIKPYQDSMFKRGAFSKDNIASFIKQADKPIPGKNKGDGIITQQELTDFVSQLGTGSDIKTQTVIQAMQKQLNISQVKQIDINKEAGAIEQKAEELYTAKDQPATSTQPAKTEEKPWYSKMVSYAVEKTKHFYTTVKNVATSVITAPAKALNLEGWKKGVSDGITGAILTTGIAVGLSIFFPPLMPLTAGALLGGAVGWYLGRGK